jgi:hypothetical protein
MSLTYSRARMNIRTVAIASSLAFAQIARNLCTVSRVVRAKSLAACVTPYDDANLRYPMIPDSLISGGMYYVGYPLSVTGCHGS